MQNALLKARIQFSGTTVTTYTMQLSEAGALVQSSGVGDIGAPVQAFLSVPGQSEEVRLAGHIRERYEATGPGEPGHLVLEWDHSESEAIRRIRELVQQLAAKGSRSPPTRFRVLLVEDSRLIRQMFAMQAKRQTSRLLLDLRAIENGQAALEAVATSPFDLLIVDYFLPDMLGSDLIAKVRDTEAGAAVPILSISTGGEEAKSATLDAGANLFLHKPLVLRDLFATINQMGATDQVATAR